MDKNDLHQFFFIAFQGSSPQSFLCAINVRHESLRVSERLIYIYVRCCLKSQSIDLEFVCLIDQSVVWFTVEVVNYNIRGEICSQLCYFCLFRLLQCPPLTLLQLYSWFLWSRSECKMSQYWMNLIITFIRSIVDTHGNCVILVKKNGLHCIGHSLPS